MKVVVGMSGGVDSAVTAKLLQDQGHEVIGVFLKTWDDTDPQCPAAIDAADARAVAQLLDIPFYSFDFSQDYLKDVFQDFLEQNKAGRTPNPDILCNKYIKFKVFLEKMEELGADKLATGHYAQNHWDEKTKKWELRRAADQTKDQTYFLYTLGQEQLSKVLFPLADLKKTEVREIATQAKFPNAKKKDSVGICMVGERNYREFLAEHLEPSPGEIHTTNGQAVGQHMGLPFYTLGQREGLGVGGVKDLPEAPWFVAKKDFPNNVLVISQDENDLLGSELTAANLHWVAGQAPAAKNFKALGQIRYRQTAEPCTVTVDGNQMHVTFDQPQRAITPGQSVVLYDENTCLGGGEIL